MRYGSTLDAGANRLISSTRRSWRVARRSPHCVPPSHERRISPKVYVQERIKEDGMLLHKLMAEEKGHVYICGGTAMGREVVSLLTGLFVSHGKQSEVEAASSIKKMASEGRLVQELWS